MLRNFLKQRILFIVFIFLTVNVSQAKVNAQSKGLNIAKKSRDVARGWQDYTVNLQMEIKLANGRSTKRFMRLKYLEDSNEGDKSLVIFDRPADVKGTALLTHSFANKPNDQWLYLPEMRRVKRISSGNKNGRFMGSEFSYDDMGSQEVEKYTYEFLRVESCGKLSCSIVKQVPKDPESAYSYLEVWYDNKENRIQRIDYYDRKNTLWKRMNKSGFKKYIGFFWSPTKLVMENLVNKNKTIVEFSEYKFKNGLAKGDFTQTQLKRVR